MACWNKAQMMSRLLRKWYCRLPLLIPERSATRVAEIAAVPCSLKSSRAVCNMRICVARVAMALSYQDPRHDPLPYYNHSLTSYETKLTQCPWTIPESFRGNGARY